MWKNHKKLNKETLRNIGLVTQLGLVVIFSLLIFFFLFLYLDRKLHTEGILLIFGVIMGVAAGILAAYHLLKKLLSEK